jgi:hypothetical protein
MIPTSTFAFRLVMWKSAIRQNSRLTHVGNSPSPLPMGRIDFNAPRRTQAPDPLPRLSKPTPQGTPQAVLQTRQRPTQPRSRPVDHDLLWRDHVRYGRMWESLYAQWAVPPVNVDIPYVAGTGTVGETLTCTMGNWSGEPTAYAYLWQRDGVPDLGTGDSYVITAADAGHSLACVVTATNPFGNTTAPPSNSVAVNSAARVHRPAR